MTYDVSMSAVRSVSGLAVDVLKLAPFLTVNHWLFLKASQYSTILRLLGHTFG